jgi:NDP-4-keto-2,6-dideoxyhexose 3-C-methyltransferase
LYGLNYGYRSGLNKSMVDHLHGKVKKIMNIVQLKDNDLVIDIGSNDGTTLAVYPSEGLDLVGIDPTGVKFRDFYKPHIKLIPDFFSKAVLDKHCGGRKAAVVTSFSMFYDLESPLSFMQEVCDVLDEEGIWVFEQSYMPTMIKTNSFDTICQEHLEYYALKQIKWMADKAGLKIINIEFNDVNGGSFSVVAAKKSSHYPEAADLEEVLARERNAGLDDLRPYVEFSNNIDRTKKELIGFIHKVKGEGKKIFGLGASTKGNVLLQYCGITEKDIPFIGEVNAEKFGAYTPGTFIPIISETDLLAKGPDYLLVLPWHFKDFFLKIPKFKNMKLVFPLPRLEVV